jgi:L-fuculose-phosphate aldolase
VTVVESAPVVTSIPVSYLDIPQPASELTARQEVALLARVLNREGWNDYNGGHITALLPDGSLLTNPLELGWDELTASDILRIDINGKLLEGTGTVIPALRLHLEYHRLHPGTKVTVHQHPKYATFYAAIGRIPPAYDQRSSGVPDEDITFYAEYDGTVEKPAMATAAAKALGDHPAAQSRGFRGWRRCAQRAQSVLGTRVALHDRLARGGG